MTRLLLRYLSERSLLQQGSVVGRPTADLSAPLNHGADTRSPCLKHGDRDGRIYASRVFASCLRGGVNDPPTGRIRSWAMICCP